MKIKSKGIEIKPYSLKELAHMYGVSTRTMKTWLQCHAEKIGNRIGRFYLITQVKTIFITLGMPGTIEDEDN